jgi:DHA1 family bicyclomycin/chloramphenicol resistance-like MFS transporter
LIRRRLSAPEFDDLRLFLVLGGLAVFGSLSIDLYLPALPAIARGLETSASNVQLTLTMCVIGLGVGQLVIGAVSDAVGRRPPLVVGLGGFAVASLACGFAQDVWTLAGLRLLQGFMGGTGIVIATAVIRDRWEGARAARYYSRLFLAIGVAPVLAPLLGSLLLRVTSWRAIFFALAVVGVLLLLVAYRGLPETLPPERRHRGGLRETASVFRVVIHDPTFVAYATVLAATIGALFGYLAGAPFVVENVHHASPQLFGLIFGINAIGFTTSAQVNGFLVGRHSPQRILECAVVGLGVGAAGTLIVTLSGAFGLTGLLVPWFVTVASAGMIIPNTMALAMAPHGRSAGSVAALLGVAQMLVSAAVAPLTGVAGTHSAVPMAILVSVLGSVAVVAVFGLTRPASRLAPAPAVEAD